MKIKKYFASDMRQALEMAREEHGSDVVILSNRKVLGGVELIAAEDYDEQIYNKSTEARQSHESNKQQPELVETIATEIEKPAKAESVSDIWTHDSTIDQMRDELKSLRSMLEQQMSGLAWGAIGRQHPLWANLIRQLINLDLTPKLARQLVEEIPEDYKFDQAWRTLLALLTYKIPQFHDNILTAGNKILFFGPSGSGKTTTIAKMATRYALEYGTQNIMLATTDIYRVGAREQIRSYARILGIPIRTINNKEDYLSLFDGPASEKLILIDTAGLSLKDKKHQEQISLLKSTDQKIMKGLILPTTEHYNGLSRLIDNYQSFNPDFCIPTKLDEATSLGGFLSVAIEKAIPIAGLCDGQRVPEDLHKMKPYELVSRVVSRANQNQIKFDEEHMEQSIGHYEFENDLKH
ncbi:MAG: flagellar biosynthesis protein FlhF [Proteobacteria bacterium]|nr:flagellar biosynthesis protein FlhF [Pseudomonadota bacterium]NOG58952.1 flagellar biosynthesis protein FlhF [Pseudomonadota bacterium]